MRFDCNTTKLTERRWRQILKTCGVDESGKQTAAPAPGMDEHRRRTLYIPSSPAPMDME
jgi:hypothetical protein